MVMSYVFKFSNVIGWFSPCAKLSKRRDHSWTRDSVARPPRSDMSIDADTLAIVHADVNARTIGQTAAFERDIMRANLMVKAFGSGKDGTIVQKPYLGLSIGPIDVAFDVAQPGDEQERKLLLHNAGTGDAVVHSVFCMPDLDGTISLSCELPAVGALVPPGASYQVTIQSKAPPAIGMHKTFVLVLLEVTGGDERAHVTSWVLLGARACLLVTDPDDLQLLSAEAPSFWPQRLRRDQWILNPGIAGIVPAPPLQMPQWVKRLPVQLDRAAPEDAAQPVLERDVRRAQKEYDAAQQQLLSGELDAEAAADKRDEWTAAHAHLQWLLLQLEELKMVRDYDALDAYYVTLREHKRLAAVSHGPAGQSAPEITLETTIISLEEQQPPVLAGDEVWLRLDSDRDGFGYLAMRVINVVNRTRLLMTANFHQMQRIDNWLAQTGRPKLFDALVQGKDLCSCHLRFRLNREPLRFMRHILVTRHIGAGNARMLRAAARQSGVSEILHDTPGLPPPASTKHLRLLLPTEADLREARGAITPIEKVQPQLNELQCDAVSNVLSGRHGDVPYIVFGPPGTGKTMVVIEAIAQILLTHEDPRVLVCAPSNAAADVVAKRLLDLLPAIAMRMLRISQADSAAGDTGIKRWWHADELGSGDPQRGIAETDMLARVVLRLNAQQRIGTPAGLLKICAQDKAVPDYFTVPKVEALVKKRVVISTCVTSHLLVEAGFPSTSWYSSSALEPPLPGFTHLLVDEASQALEAEIMLPLSLATSGCCVVLSGDHMQLGPVVRSPYCRERGLATSLLERLMKLPAYALDAQPVWWHNLLGDSSTAPLQPGGGRARCVTKLLNNYRSHGALLTLPSRLFYDNQLVEAADVEETTALASWGELPAQGLPLLVYGVQGEQWHEMDSPSYYNLTECTKVVQLIQALLRQGAIAGVEISAAHIGVVTPFRKQVIKLRTLLRQKQLSAINVGTVDDFQGQEQRILFISTVLTRNVADHHLVFNAKRFNVAVTRARALLVVVGHPLAMLDDPSWSELLRYAVELDAYKGCAHPLKMEGADDDVDEAASRMTEIARDAERALGAGNMSTMFPSLSAATHDDLYAEHDDLPWRVML